MIRHGAHHPLGREKFQLYSPQTIILGDALAPPAYLTELVFPCKPFVPVRSVASDDFKAHNQTGAVINIGPSVCAKESFITAWS